MTLKNIVVAGDYKDGIITYKNAKKGLMIAYKAGKVIKTTEKKFINKETVQSCELVDTDESKSFASGVARGVVGGALFGGVGAIAGAASGKKKNIYRVSIVFRDGTQALCDLDKFNYSNLEKVLY